MVEAAITELGYSPHPAARALASNQSQTIGLVTTTYRGGFFGALMDNVQSEAESRRKQLLVTQGKIALTMNGRPFSVYTTYAVMGLSCT